LNGNFFLVETRIGQNFAQGAFELAHVGAHVFGDKKSHFLRHVEPSTRALLIKIATRISNSGGSMATVRPESKRDTKRSWMSVKPLG
jgi:hypothetical protein